MSWLWNNLLLWGSILWVPALMHVVLCNEVKFKKNMVVGVTLPLEARKDAEVQILLSAFRKESRTVCVLLTLSALPAIFIRSFAVSFLLWSVWLIAVVVVPNIPFARCNKRLKALKQARGWRGQKSVVADLRVAAQPMKWLSPLHFVLPFLLSLLPLLFESGRMLWWLYLLDAAVVLLFWGCYRYAYRTKSDVVNEDTALTEALTRIRRHQWNRCWLWCSWYAATLNLAIWLGFGRSGWMLAVILVLSAALTAVVLRAEFRTRKLQEQLTADTGAKLYLDEDDQWLWGLIYYNPNDASLMVNNRVGMGTTFNLAKRSAQIIMAVTALLLALPLGMGLWFLQTEKTPVTLTATQTELVAAHTGTEYTIPLEEIETVELIPELPSIGRIWGTGTDTVLKGEFSSPWGAVKVCVDPRTGPWVLVTTRTGVRYLLGTTDGVAWPYSVTTIHP